MELDLRIQAVIVVIFIIGIMLFLFFIIGPPQEPDFKADISIEASQNKTSYIITVKSVRKEFYENDTVMEEGKLEYHPLIIRVERDNNSWTRPLLYKLDELGMKYFDINENDYFDKGDKIIIDKDGGKEYSPKGGDEIRIEDDGGNYHIDSNTIKLPMEL